MKNFSGSESTNEEQRLRDVDGYRPDLEPDPQLDQLTRLATRVFDVPIALVSLVDKDIQIFSSKAGLEIAQTARSVSFCTHAIENEGDFFFISDALKDERFAFNPLVIGPPFVRFYAGKTLISASGQKIGTLCLKDSKPRASFSQADRELLTEIADLVMKRLELWRLNQLKTVSQARFEKIASTSPDAIICTNAGGEIHFWNRSAETLFNYSSSEALMMNIKALIAEDSFSSYIAIKDELSAAERGVANKNIELTGKRKSGEEFPAEVSFSTWKEGEASVAGVIIRDITEQRRNIQHLTQLASTDGLTGLPNRNAWKSTLTDRLNAKEKFSVLLFDLDGFKLVNDTLGHFAGDSVLKEVANRLQLACPDAIKLARLGGDEFAALIPDDNVQRVSHIAEYVIKTVSEPYFFLGQRVSIGTSVGLAFSPEHGTEHEEIIGAADLALYKAKSAGRGRYEIYSPGFRESYSAKSAFRRELLNAYENREFELYYQPQVDRDNFNVVGAEATLRWHHPVRGLVSPASFIDVLNEKPSAEAVGEWVVKTACEQAAKWQKFNPSFRIGVKIFDAQLRSQQLYKMVKTTLAKNQLPASGLELGIIEASLFNNESKILTSIQDLRKLGITIAFEKYGIGFTSFDLLKRHPVDRLKIDRKLMKNVAKDKGNAALVRAILSLAESFNMNVVADGVEDQSQLDFLPKKQCKYMQGYFFGKPQPAGSFEKLYFGRSN